MEHTAEWTLQSAMNYIAAHYGATQAHHILAIALRQVQEEVNETTTEQ